MRVDWSLVLTAFTTLFGVGALSRVLWPSLWRRSVRAEVEQKEADWETARIRQATSMAETAIGLYTKLAEQTTRNSESQARLEASNSDMALLLAKQAHQILELQHLQRECEEGKTELMGNLLRTEQEILLRQGEITDLRGRIEELARQIGDNRRGVGR